MNSSTDAIEFKFDHTPTIRTESNCIQNMRNLMVCRTSVRCFSPVTGDIFSPGISPIFAPNDLSAGDHYDREKSPSFIFPKTTQSINNKVSPSSKNSPMVGLPQQNLSSDITGTNGNSSFELDLSTSNKLESTMEVSSRSEISIVSNILDRTMNVTALLKSIGLGVYSEKFAKAGIDLESFLKITPTDLKSLGFQSDEECNAIIDMLNIIN